MRQQDRDRLVALKKAQKGLITQRQAAGEMGQTERHIRRLRSGIRKENSIPPVTLVLQAHFKIGKRYTILRTEFWMPGDAG